MCLSYKWAKQLVLTESFMLNKYEILQCGCQQLNGQTSLGIENLGCCSTYAFVFLYNSLSQKVMCDLKVYRKFWA